jgi:hypothetical protein
MLSGRQDRHAAARRPNQRKAGLALNAESKSAGPAAPEEPVGLECRQCGCRHFDTVETRKIAGGRIRRRRECRHCGRRITTIEREQGTPLDAGPEGWH